MSIKIVEVKTKAEAKNFVNFQFELYKNTPMWVPPIKADEVKALDKQHNPAFDFCDAHFFLAYKNDKIVGRIGTIINHDYNKKVGEKLGRINRAEFIDDKEVSKALFTTAENWLKEKGMEKVHGPLGFTNIDQQGLLIEGFDFLPSIASVYNHPYYQQHFEVLGYEKENDWVEFRLTIGDAAAKKASRGSAMIKRRYGFESVNFTKTSELKKYGETIFEILNDAFKVLPYTVPFSKK